ncbi:hypothetical protein [Plantactinospora sp. KBS50]|uniref:hypothetical protein n=1 Tax=Plantactinospora sp. KBS50 TaxID=2024580 RepID=UPI000BAADE04|nr:hypothetical protein [Plantactinospora sp. KBS50]ASW52980.1 hypothetical protein CIK06_00415 [Plantactinospora sp. KBS50]
MTIDSENLSNGPGKPERFGGKYRGARRDSMLAEAPLPTEGTARDGGGPPEPAAIPSLSMAGLSEPVFEPADWTGNGEPLLEHPLLRGLLMELPPKGSGPSPEWLDRWFEATRAILDLLYSQGGGKR